MKKLLLTCGLSLFALAGAADAEVISDRQSQPSATSQAVNPQLVKAACSDALMREETRPKRFSILDVSVVPGGSFKSVGCWINVLVQEKDRPMTELRYKATYAGVLELDSGTVTLARVDEPAAKEAALSTLAGMFIDMKVVSASKDKMTYQAAVNSQSCTVVVETSDRAEPKRWLVSNVSCKGKKGRNEKN